MTLRRVTLVKNALKLAGERHANVGFLTDPNQDVRGLDPETGKAQNLNKGGVTVQVTSREFHLLEQAGLIEPGSVELVAPAADQPEAEQAQAEAKQTQTNQTAAQRAGDRDTAIKADKVDVQNNPGGSRTTGRGPSGTGRSAGAAGSGHQQEEGWNNARVQDEIRRTQERGAAERA